MGPDDTYYEWDVSSYLVGEDRENVSFVLYDEGRDNTLVSFSSSEGSNPPELKLLYARGNTTVSNLVLNAANIIDQPQELSVIQSADSTPLAGTEISTEISTEVSNLSASGGGGGGGGSFGLQFLFLLLITAMGGVRQKLLSARLSRR